MEINCITYNRNEKEIYAIPRIEDYINRRMHICSFFRITEKEQIQVNTIMQKKAKVTSNCKLIKKDKVFFLNFNTQKIYHVAQCRQQTRTKLLISLPHNTTPSGTSLTPTDTHTSEFRPLQTSDSSA